VVAGIGDDCAVLRVPPRHDLLVTTDFTVEKVHFRRDWHRPELVGRRCLTRGLSDQVQALLDPDWQRAFLNSLARPTGGRMFVTGKKQTLDEIFHVIEEELRSQYSIGFAPLNAAHDGKFRKLEVKVRPKGLRVSARRGYYAPGVPKGGSGAAAPQ